MCVGGARLLWPMRTGVIREQTKPVNQALHMPQGCGCCKEISEWDTEMIHKNKVLMGQALFFISCESVFEVDESQTLRQFRQSRLTSPCRERQKN